MSFKNSSANQISVTDFKARCLQYFEETGRKGKEFTILKKGQPIARVIPFKKQRGSRLGSLKDLARVKGDIVSFDTSHLWNVLKK